MKLFLVALFGQSYRERGEELYILSGSEALTCRSAVAAMGVASSALEASSPGFCRPFPRSYVSSSR